MGKRPVYSFIFILILLFPFVNYAQNITGKVIDQDKNPMEFAAVAIINPVDSILISYASVDKYGKFVLKNISEGERIFQINLIGYRTYQKIIEFKGEPIDMGIITLKEANELDEIVVKAITPVTIKKDTVAYNTKAFKVRTDDSVEDLLKKLPGIEIDAAGKITAQGEDVGKVYVDGKEFFSGDPTIATKNLSADAIKNIQVIDEKSEKARVSGVNDSERKKVINLALKDDKKVNDFGKIQGGYGTDDRYLTSLNYNRFSSKLQTSIIGKFNNVNTSGSDISEIINFDTGGRAFFRGSGNTNSGFLTTGIGGFNLGYEIEKKQNLNADYFYNYTNFSSGDVFTTRTEFINNLEIHSESHSKSENIGKNHKLNFSYTDKSKTLSSLEIRGNVKSADNTGNSVSSLDKFNGENELDLQSIGGSNGESDNNSGQVSFEYNKRFNETSKRNISTSGAFNAAKNKTKSNNNQLNKFNISDPDNAFESKEEISRDQEIDNLGLNANFEYTEPITDKHLIEFRARVDHNNTNDDVAQEKFVNDIIQNPLIYTQYYNNTNLSGRLRYKYDNDKFTFAVGAVVLDQFQNFGLENDVEYKNTYTNINPELSIRYRPIRGKFMRLSLKKSVNLPGINQLTPVVNDFNPLFIRKGNPNLTPEDNYSASAMFIRHNFATGFSIFSRIGYSYTNNSIVNSEFTDALGIRYSTYENLGDKSNFNLAFNFGNRLNSLGLRYNIRLKGSYNEYMTIINKIENETKSKDGTLGLSLENNKKEKLDAMIGANWTKNYTSFTSGNNVDRDYLQQTYYIKTDWNVTNRFNINSQFKYDIYSDSSFGTNQAVPIWNASLSYSLLKSKSMTIMVSALDILNKNIGIVRNSSDNYFEETHREVLGNYYMLSLTYNLNGNKNPNASKSGPRNGPRRGHRMH